MVGSLDGAHGFFLALLLAHHEALGVVLALVARAAFAGALATLGAGACAHPSVAVRPLVVRGEWIAPAELAEVVGLDELGAERA